MTAEQLHITLFQYNVQWLSVEENLAYISKQNIPATHILVLPEMFATGFCMQPKKVSQKEDGSIIHWMKSFSEEKNIAICGSVAIEENNKYYNRFYFIHKGKIMATYNKRHLFTYSGEDKVYEKGHRKVVFEHKGWKICPQICYDLRFPVFHRNTEEYDVLLNVANWPNTRINAWNTLLQARAIENICYSIGCNRIGIDGNNLEYPKSSGIYNFLGESISLENSKEIVTIAIEYAPLQAFRKQFPFLKDQDTFTLL